MEVYYKSKIDKKVCQGAIYRRVQVVSQANTKQSQISHIVPQSLV